MIHAEANVQVPVIVDEQVPPDPRYLQVSDSKCPSLLASAWTKIT